MASQREASPTPSDTPSCVSEMGEEIQRGIDAKYQKPAPPAPTPPAAETADASTDTGKAEEPAPKKTKTGKFGYFKETTAH